MISGLSKAQEKKGLKYIGLYVEWKKRTPFLAGRRLREPSSTSVTCGAGEGSDERTHRLLLVRFISL